MEPIMPMALLTPITPIYAVCRGALGLHSDDVEQRFAVKKDGDRVGLLRSWPGRRSCG